MWSHHPSASCPPPPPPATFSSGSSSSCSSFCLFVCTTQIDPKLVEALLPSIATLDPVWVNKVVPAVVRAFDADYLVRLVRAIAPVLSKVNPDLLVALLPLVNTISLETWQKLIELLNKLTIAQVRVCVCVMFWPGKDRQTERPVQQVHSSSLHATTHCPAAALGNLHTQTSHRCHTTHKCSFPLCLTCVCVCGCTAD